MQATAFLLFAAVGSPWAIPDAEPASSEAVRRRPATRAQLDDQSILDKHRADLERATQQHVAPVAPKLNPYRRAPAGGNGEVRLAGYEQPEPNSEGVKLAQNVPTAWPTTSRNRDTIRPVENRAAIQPSSGLGEGDPYPASHGSKTATAAGTEDFSMPDFDTPDYRSDTVDTDTFKSNTGSGLPGSAPNRGLNPRNVNPRSVNPRVTGEYAGKYDQDDSLTGGRPLPGRVRPPSQADRVVPQQPSSRPQSTPVMESPRFDPLGTIGAMGTQQRPTGYRQAQTRSAAPPADLYNREDASTQPPVLKQPRVGPPTYAQRPNVGDVGDNDPLAGVAAEAKEILNETGVAAGNAADRLGESTRGGNGLLLLAFFASVGLNFYLGWIAWDTYNRYQDMVSDMRYSGSSPRRERLDRDVERRGDRRLAETY